MGGHEVFGLDGAQGDDVFVGAAIAHDADGLDGKKNGERLGRFLVPAGEAQFLDEYRVRATQEVCDILARDVFNGTVYPPFQNFDNGRTRVMEFVPFREGEEFRAGGLSFKAVAVSHIVPTVGLVIKDAERTVAFSSDTSATEEFWRVVNREPRLDALLIEASFPNSMAKLAAASGHLTPAVLGEELRKLAHKDVEVLAMHLKPSFRAQLVEELEALGVPRLSAMEPGREYEW